MGKEVGSKKGPERIAQWYRNFNLAVGGAALVLAGIVPTPELKIGLLAYGALNIAQAGLAEVVRGRVSKSSRKKAVLKPA